MPYIIGYVGSFKQYARKADADKAAREQLVHNDDRNTGKKEISVFYIREEEQWYMPDDDDPTTGAKLAGFAT